MSRERPDVDALVAAMRTSYPSLLVDRVLEVRPGESIRGLKNVTINEPYFQGHFPGYPVMPGVLILEALAQLSAGLAHASGLVAPDGGPGIAFTGLDGCRFKRQVVPGDTLTLESRWLPGEGGGSFAVRALVDGQLAAEATLRVVLK